MQTLKVRLGERFPPTAITPTLQLLTLSLLLVAGAAANAANNLEHAQRNQTNTSTQYRTTTSSNLTSL